MSREIIIQVLDLTKFYGEILAVDHINFDVKRGEIFGFLGPNGAGKTTTIRILTGLSKPTEGKASVLGFDINSEIVEAKRHIGVVPEISNLYDEFSAIDNLLFMAQLYGVPRPQRRKRAEELLKIFGLHERKDSPFRTFSRGMKRALTIAAALIHNPKLLFLDEPTVGLDVVAARSLRNLIGNLRQQGITIFLTTHYLEEADLLCDRVAILVKGRIIKVDSPQTLKATTEEESVIEFSFDREISALLDDLSNRLSGVKIVTVDQDRVRIYGGIPPDLYDKVFRFAKDKNIGIQSVNSIKPTLEDAFIKITGLSPTVMAIEKGGKCVPLLVASANRKLKNFRAILTNDIKGPVEALRVYRDKDYVEKSFDDLKNQLDMKRLRIHTSSTMDGRLFIQFIALIYLSALRKKMRDTSLTEKYTVRELLLEMETLTQIRYSGKYGHILTEITKPQRQIMESLGIDPKT